MKWICLLAIYTGLSGCTSNERPVADNLHATVTRSTILPVLPSGSAIQMLHGAIYIISDDAPCIYRITTDGVVQDSIRLQHLPHAARRIPKPIKPDYEAAVGARINGQDCIVAFGSGSLRPQRDSAVIVPVSGDMNHQVVASLATLYKAMRQQAGISEADFNIEAAALNDNLLLLFNRGTNHVFLMDWQMALKHLTEDAACPAISSAALVMPRVNGLIPGFSGACFIDTHRILFCASVEATKDWVSDGEVMGSYVGILELPAEGRPRLLAIAPMLDQDGKVLKTKLEGIHTYMPVDKDGFEVLGIVDNDDGTSRLLQIFLKNVPAL